MQKRKRPYILWTSLFIIFIIILLNFYKKKQRILQTAQEQMYIVWTWDIQATVKVSSLANLVDEQELSFGQEGKITQVFVQAWDTVQAWQILAELDTETYTNAIQSASIDLENAELALEKLLNNDTSLQESQLRTRIQQNNESLAIEKSQRKLLEQQLLQWLSQKEDLLEQRQRDYAQAEQQFKTSQTGIQVQSDTEQEQYEQARKTREQNINTILTTLNTLSLDLYTAIENIDKIFGVSDIYEQDAQDYLQSIATRNTKLRREVRTAVINAYKHLEAHTNSIKKLSQKSSDDHIDTIIQQFLLKTPAFEELTSLTQEAFDMTNTWPLLSEAQLQWFINTSNASKQTIISTRAQLETLQRSLSSLLSLDIQQDQVDLSKEEQKNALAQQALALQKQKEDISLLQQDITVLQQDKEQQLARTHSQIRTLETNTLLLEQELQDIIDGADVYDIQQQQNAIRQAQLNIQRITEQLDNYQIIAEFDGRVRSVDIKVGEQYSLEERTYIIVENPNLIELELQVNQVDIVNIQEGDTVYISFDAYPDQKISAEISKRNVNPQNNGRWWVYYEATIILAKQELEILAGMTAIVEVITQSIQEVLRVPNVSLTQKDQQTYVYKLDEPEENKNTRTWITDRIQQRYKRLFNPDLPNYTLHPVRTGMQNNFYTEIQAWLQIGDTIKWTILDEETLETMWIGEQDGALFSD